MPKTLADTLHFKLAQLLRADVGKMKVGDPLPTVLELKQKFQCSQATVERAIDRLRREGLVVRPLGTLRLTVAHASDPATFRVAMIRPDYPSPTFEELSRVIIEAGKRRNWAFDLETYRTLSSLDLAKAMGDNDGAILLPMSERFPDHLLVALRRPNRPVVIIQDPPEGVRVSSVRIDDEEVGRLAVEHLAALGHRRILLLLSEPPAPSGQYRSEGWRRTMETIGERNLDELVVDPKVRPFDNSMLSTYEFFTQFLRQAHAPFTAVFCPACTGAVAALRALREAGISVPRDVSVVAHGGEGYLSPFLFPSLTAVETDITSYAEKIVELLEMQLLRTGDTQNLTVASKLIQRETTAKVRR